MDNCFRFDIFYFAVLVFANQPIVHSAKVSRGGSLAVAVGITDRGQVIFDTQQATRDTWQVKCCWHWRWC